MRKKTPSDSKITKESARSFPFMTIYIGIIVIVVVSLFIRSTMIEQENCDDTQAQPKILTQTFTVRDVDGSEGIARQTFGDPTGKTNVSSSAIQADIIKFVDCSANDITSIVLYFSDDGASILGANICYVSKACDSPVRIAFLSRDYRYSTSQALMSSVSEFVSEPLRNVIDIEYGKDLNGEVSFVTIMYENEHLY